MKSAAKLNEFGDVRCPQDGCNTNILKPINAYHVAGIGKCLRCLNDYELTQAEIDRFAEGLKC